MKNNTLSEFQEFLRLKR